ncbi:DUF1656 domain-containing protein [Pseudomonas sp. IT-P176]|nr:hypothetical protein PS834_03671 [Pseudomonas fluorescens]
MTDLILLVDKAITTAPLNLSLCIALVLSLALMRNH